MKEDESDDIKKIASECLSSPILSLECISSFCASLKEMCEKLRSDKVHGKKEEQHFCLFVIKQIIVSLKKRTSEIFGNPSLSEKKKSQQLVDLAYIAQTLTAFAKIQHRFGGRLGFHCLPHTALTAEYPDPMVMCAGANHDAVMRYKPPPDFESTHIKTLREEYHRLRNCFDNSANAHVEMNSIYHNDIKTLKDATEQKRIAGWRAGTSEWDSANQMEVQIEEIIGIMEKCDERNEHQAVIKHFKDRLKAQKTDRSELIRRTIPNQKEMAPPGFGNKLETIGNSSVLPCPADLANIDQPLRDRFIKLMDQVIVELKGVGTPTFQQAFDDIKDAEAFYSLATKLQAADPSASQDEIKKSVKAQMNKESKFTSGKTVPSYETVDLQILSMMPPFNDPMKPLKNIHQQDLVLCLKKHLLLDVEHSGDTLLIDYLLDQIDAGIVGNQDLGGLMKEKGVASFKNWMIGLIVEENPYQARHFFNVNHKLRKEGGLASEKWNRILAMKENGEKWGITEEERLGTLEFMDLAFWFMNKNLPYSQGAILRMQLYILAPMKAVQETMKDPHLEACFEKAKIMKLNNIIQDFERQFCINGTLRDDVLQKLKHLIAECTSASALCLHIVDAMREQFGIGFLAAPQDYGYTIDNVVNPEYLQEQDQASLLHDIEGFVP